MSPRDQGPLRPLGSRIEPRRWADEPEQASGVILWLAGILIGILFGGALTLALVWTAV